MMHTKNCTTGQSCVTKPQLPQEILDRVIKLSLNVVLNTSILGFTPDEPGDFCRPISVANEASVFLQHSFKNPLCQVNRACRRQVLRLISAIGWIQLRPLHPEAHVHEYTRRFVVLDPFWTAKVIHGNTPCITFEVDPKRPERMTGEVASGGRTHAFPYSYATMLQLMCELKPFVKHYRVTVHCDRLDAVRAQEVESILTFLDPQSTGLLQHTGKRMSIPLVYETEWSVETLSAEIARIGRAVTLVDSGGQTWDSELRRKLRSLYLNNYLTEEFGHHLSWLRSPWASSSSSKYPFIDTARAEQAGLAETVFHMEETAQPDYQDMCRTYPEWIAYHGEYLTNFFTRWIKPAGIRGRAMSEDEKAESYHVDAAVMNSYMLIFKYWTDLSTEPCVFYCCLRYRTLALMMASRLRPGDVAWANEARAAERDFLRLFPPGSRSWIPDEMSPKQEVDVEEADGIESESQNSWWNCEISDYLDYARGIASVYHPRWRNR